MKLRQMGILLLSGLLLAGCGNTGGNTEKESSTQTETKMSESAKADCDADKEVYFTNLADEESKEELKEILLSAGISETRVSGFFEHVNQFNSCPGMEKLVTDFKALPFEEQTFDEYELQDAWNEAYPDFTGYNCRITAFSLMADFISVEDTSSPDERNIFLDSESLETDSSALAAEGDPDKFKALFSTVDGENTTDQSVQIEKVLSERKDRGITFAKGPLSLVTLYIHANYDENDNELFVGHTGILIDQGEDGMYFVEKLAFQAPYRFIRLEDREQLKNYLLTRYASYYGENEAAPFVLLNNEVMK